MTTLLASVPGVPETHLPDDLAEALPENRAPAPWHVRSNGLVWWNRAGDAASTALSEVLGRPTRASLVVGGVVRYDETPVGRYDEVFGVIGHRHGRRMLGTVAFMAVDSTASLVGGRGNWAMPKTLAEFRGELSESFEATSSTPSGWRVRAVPRVAGPALPGYLRQRLVQRFPDGGLRQATMTARTRSRLGRVRVDVDSAGPLPEWLPPGRHLGALVTSMVADFTPATPVTL